MNILLVDDHQMMRDGLRAVLERESDLHVSGEAADGRTALDAARALRYTTVIKYLEEKGAKGGKNPAPARGRGGQ